MRDAEGYATEQRERMMNGPGDAPGRRDTVATALDRVECALNINTELGTRLEAQLQPILGPYPESTKNGNVAAALPPTRTVREHLHRLADQLEYTNRQIDMLLSRIEL